MALTRRDVLRAGTAAAGLLMVPGVARFATAGGPVSYASLRPDGPPRVGPWRVLAGSLHDHSLDSDGDTLSETVVRWLAAHREALGIDFATMSDHSDFFPLSGGVFEGPATALGLPPAVNIPPNQPTAAPTPPCTLPGQSGYASGKSSCGALLPDPAADPTYAVELWRRQGELMTQFNSRAFSFLRGFEWTNDQQNHFNVLMSSNFTSRAVTGDGAMSMLPFWTWFNAPPQEDPTGHGLGWGGADAIGMFNHPGDKGALNWDDYGYNPAAAERVALIEIHGDQSRGGRGSTDAGWYWFALARGWNVSPVMNWDWHEWSAGGVLGNSDPGGGYGTGGYLPGQRSLILAKDARADSIRAALLRRRTSASETPDLWATLQAGSTWQGSTVSAEPGETLRLTVEAGSGVEPLTHVEIIGDNGVDPHDYYERDNSSWDGYHAQLTPSFIVQHERFVASGGKATRKDRLDVGPPGSVVATASLSGSRSKISIDVPVPTKPSPRPDGRHFFYAIVYAGNDAAPARCWTGPIHTER